MGGHAKCLLLMTRGEGGGSKIPKTCLRNTWMFPNLAGLLDTNSNDHTASDKNSLLPDHVLNRKVHVMPQTMGT